MIKNIQYSILNPEGIQINNGETYPTKIKAFRAFVKWKDTYTSKLRYTSPIHGWLRLIDLKDFCQLVEHQNQQTPGVECPPSRSDTESGN